MFERAAELWQRLGVNQPGSDEMSDHRATQTFLGKASKHVESVEVNEVIEEVLRRARTDLIGRGVTLTRALAEGLPPVRGDRIQLQQVLLNLIRNACCS